MLLTSFQVVATRTAAVGNLIVRSTPIRTNIVKPWHWIYIAIKFRELYRRIWSNQSIWINPVGTSNKKYFCVNPFVKKYRTKMKLRVTVTCNMVYLLNHTYRGKYWILLFFNMTIAMLWAWSLLQIHLGYYSVCIWNRVVYLKVAKHPSSQVQFIRAYPC